MFDESDDFDLVGFDWVLPEPNPLQLPPHEPDPTSITSLTSALPPLVLPAADLGVGECSALEFVPQNLLARLRLVANSAYDSPCYLHAISDSITTMCAAVEMMNEATLLRRRANASCDNIVYHARRSQGEYMLRIMMAPFSALTDAHTEPLPQCVDVIKHQRCLSERYPFRLPHALPAESCNFLREHEWDSRVLVSLPPSIRAHTERVQRTSLSGPSVSRPLNDTALPSGWASRAVLMCDSRSSTSGLSPTCTAVLSAMTGLLGQKQHPTSVYKQGISALRLHHQSVSSSAFTRKRPIGSREHCGLARLSLFLMADRWRHSADHCCAALSLFSRIGTTPSDVDFEEAESAVECIVARKRRKVVSSAKPKILEQSVLKF